MIKKSISLVLALLSGIIPIENEKNISFDNNFSLSLPKFSQLDSGETEINPYVSALKNQVNLYGTAENLPESYDMRDSGNNISAVRDQTGYGTCWAHSAIASAETSVIGIKPEMNLSEFHTAYYTYSGGDQIEPVSDNISDNLSRGGNIFAVTNLWSQWLGPVLEKRIRYGNIGFFENEDAVADMKYESDYHMRNAYMFDYDADKTNLAEVNNLVKQFVYGGNAVDISFHSNQAVYYNTEYFTTNSNKKPKFANHSVVIAGWDDNYPAENFTIKPENNGAWLVKNSWGDDFGENGYMWISYEDTSLCEFAVYELEDAEKYLFNYNHDTFVALQSLSADDDSEINDGSYMANVFHNDDYTQIEAVSTYINVPDTDYEITVYTGLTDISDPTSGMPSAVTKGNQALTGYFTLELDENVIVEPDEDFSVVVKLYSENSPFVIPLETCIAVTDNETGKVTSLGSFTTYEGIKEYTAENESFYSADGAYWKDVTSEDYIYTDEEVEIILGELEDELYDGIEPDDTEGLKNAELAIEVYKDIFASGTTSVVMGNISLKALGNPVGAVSFSHDSGIVPNGTKIELSAKNNENIYYSINKSEFIPYIEPIEVNELTEIYAVWDIDKNDSSFSERIYIPESEFAGYGDVDVNGLIDASDAGKILEHYSESSTGGGVFHGIMADYADLNQDNIIDSNDATQILILYAELSTK